MPPAQRDDSSISKDSVFDWGLSIGSHTWSNAEPAGRTNSSPDNNDGPSRYDPKAMNRITDCIDDLMSDGESSVDSIDDAIRGRFSVTGADSPRPKAGNGRKKKKKKKKKTRYGLGGVGSTPCRQVVSVVALIAIIVGAILAIGYVVIDNEPGSDGPQLVSKSPVAESPIAEGGMPGEQQELLETAERVISACSESGLDADMRACQLLCQSKMCCFDSGQYSCQSDESKACAVYAGCEALLEGIPTEATEDGLNETLLR